MKDVWEAWYAFETFLLKIIIVFALRNSGEIYFVK